MKTRFLALALLAPMAGILTWSHETRACAGFVAPAESNAVVNSHRIALSISPTQTVLWDQIQYKGDPKSFGWILPVKPGAMIELSTDAWFEALEAATTTNVMAPEINCGNSGCGSSDLKAGNFDGSSNGVDVVHRGTVGPFDTVTLSTKTPGVLDDWLTNAGFTLPADAAPVIDAYVKEGFDFIALKMQPGKGIDEMKPVRVVQKGAIPVLPMRMISVGTGANVGITLYIIGEGRWEAKDATNTVIPLDLLAWDFEKGSSNYSELHDRALGLDGGNVWLTNFARQQGLTTPLNRNLDVNNDFNFTSILGETYIRQGLKNGEATDSTCATTFRQFSASSRLVVDPCPAGVPSYDASCGTVGANETDARLFECGATDPVEETTLDDIATALNGLHPKDVWVTRLEANLPRSALTKDLEIMAATNQVEISADLTARLGKNACGSTIAPLAIESSNNDKGRALMIMTMLGAACLAFMRKVLRQPSLQNAG